MHDILEAGSASEGHNNGVLAPCDEHLNTCTHHKSETGLVAHIGGLHIAQIKKASKTASHAVTSDTNKPACLYARKLCLLCLQSVHV